MVILAQQRLILSFHVCLGYISALIPEGKEPSLENVKGTEWPANVHLIGKDILRFHAVKHVLGLRFERRHFEGLLACDVDVCRIDFTRTDFWTWLFDKGWFKDGEIFRKHFGTSGIGFRLWS